MWKKTHQIIRRWGKHKVWQVRHAGHNVKEIHQCSKLFVGQQVWVLSTGYMLKQWMPLWYVTMATRMVNKIRAWSAQMKTVLKTATYQYTNGAAVAHERPWSCCQKCRCRLQLNTHALYVCGFAWSCMVYTEHTEMAAVSCGTSHVSAVSTPLRWICENML